MPVNGAVAPPFDTGIDQRQFVPDQSDLGRQLAIATANFRNAQANRHNDIAAQGLNMMQDALGYAQPRVIASPFARAQNQLRF
jgi:hypothetical protein